MNALRETTQQLHISLLGPPIESPIDEQGYRRVLQAMAQEHVDGLIIGDQLEHVTYRRLIVDLAYNGRLPTVYPYREHFEVGGTHGVWSLPCRCFPPPRELRRPDFKGRKSRRVADLLSVEVRVADKFDHRKIPRT